MMIRMNVLSNVEMELSMKKRIEMMEIIQMEMDEPQLA